MMKNKEKDWHKAYYIQKIVCFVLNMTAYEGEWHQGYHHQYDIHIQDVIDKFIIFRMISENGDLYFEGYDKLSKGVVTIHAEDYLTRRTAKKIYKILKRINIFK